ncbi:MAG: uridine kinase [Eubacteriaceae bacterium]|nr:uridine kinase [Eubacteriaceae bacterium]
MKPVIIGIAGGSGSGKTTLTRNISERFSDDVCVICHDSYYKDQSHLTMDQRVLTNYDHPDSIQTDLMISHLRQLKEGKSVLTPVYSFVEHTRTSETVKVDPRKVIIIDGILIFENKELRDMMDMKIYVDTDSDIRLIRRLLRDVNERGRDIESVTTQYITTVKPMHEQFVEPSKKFADIIIPEGGQNKVALSMIYHRIRSILNESDEE